MDKSFFQTSKQVSIMSDTAATRMPPTLSSCPRYSKALREAKPFLMPAEESGGQPNQVVKILPPPKENRKIRFQEEILVTEIEDRFYYQNQEHFVDDDEDSYEIEIVEDDGDADFYLEIVDGEVFYVFETEDDISLDSSDEDDSSVDSMELNNNSLASSSAPSSALLSSDDDEEESEYEEIECSSSYISNNRSIASMDVSMTDMNFELEDMQAPNLDRSDHDTAQSALPKPASPQKEESSAASATATPTAEDPPMVINIVEMETEQEAKEHKDEPMMVDVVPQSPSTTKDGVASLRPTDDDDKDKNKNNALLKSPPVKPERQPSATLSGSGLKDLRASVKSLQKQQEPQQPPTLPEPSSSSEAAPAPAQEASMPTEQTQDSSGNDDKPFDEIKEGNEATPDEPTTPAAPAAPESAAHAGAGSEDQPASKVDPPAAELQDIVSPLSPPKMGVLEATNIATQDVPMSPIPAAISTPPQITTPPSSPSKSVSPGKSPCTPSRLASPGKSILRANPPSPHKHKKQERRSSKSSKSSKDGKSKKKKEKKEKTFSKTYVRPEEYDGEHRVYSWEKPDWAKPSAEGTAQTKLRSTGMGEDVRKGANLANPITFCKKAPVNYPGVEEDDEKAGTKVALPEVTSTAATATATAEGESASPSGKPTSGFGGMDMAEVMRRLNAGERVGASGVPYYRKNHRELRISINGAKIRDGSDIIKPITMATIMRSDDDKINKVANQKVLKSTQTGQHVREGKNLAAPVTMPLIKFDDTNHVANQKVLKNKVVAPAQKKQYDWEKPAWAQQPKLKSTNKGNAVKQGMDLQAPITHIASLGRSRSFDSQDGRPSRSSDDDCRIAVNKDDNKDRAGQPQPQPQQPQSMSRHLISAEKKTHEWEKPTWTKVTPLGTTSKGLALKKGQDIASPITFPMRRPQIAAKVAQPEDVVAGSKEQQQQPEEQQEAKPEDVIAGSKEQQPQPEDEQEAKPEEEEEVAGRKEQQQQPEGEQEGISSTTEVEI